MSAERARIVLDTSFLISAVKFRIDVGGALAELAGAELIISERAIEELSAIASSARRSAPHARVALSILSKLPIHIVPTSQPVDDWILENAARDPAVVVATVDRGLRRKLSNLNVRVLTVRGRKKIAFA